MENISHSCAHFSSRESLDGRHQLSIVYQGIMFIQRIIVTSAGNKVGKETWLLIVSSCQTFVRLIGSAETEQTSSELLIELLAIWKHCKRKWLLLNLTTEYF